MRYKSFFALLMLLLIALAAPGWADGNIGTNGTTYTWDGTTGALTVTGGEFTLEQWQAVIGEGKAIEPTAVKNVTFDNTKLTDSAFRMFFRWTSLTTVDLRGLDTSGVTNMESMFDGCERLTALDLRGLDTSAVQDMSSMFYSCFNLTAIIVGADWTTGKVTDSSWMFDGCYSLAGGGGTKYDRSKPKDKTYAHIDGGTSDPGYLTAISPVTGVKLNTQDIFEKGEM